MMKPINPRTGQAGTQQATGHATEDAGSAELDSAGPCGPLEVDSAVSLGMRIGSLFSGIGGLELGLEWAGLGHVVWQVEQDQQCRAVLAKHWPEVVKHEDVRCVGAGTLDRVDLICGGFPCQDVSIAGGGAGLAGARSGLWFEFRRVVEELRPRWVVVENVAGGASRWVDAVRESLEQLGYVSLPVPLSAADVGAPHKRARVFIVAHANGEFVRNELRGRRGQDGSGAPIAGHDGSQEPVGDAVQSGRPRAGQDAYRRREEPSARGWWASEPAVGRVVDGLPGGLDGRRRRAALRQLGNAVVPHCAEVVGHVIRQLSAEPRHAG